MFTCNHCGSVVPSADDSHCESCEAIAHYWYDRREACHQTWANAQEDGCPQWVVDYWTD